MSVVKEKKEEQNMAELTYGSPEEFEKELLESPTPCLVDFYADWCGPCRMLAPILEKLEKEYEGRVKIVKVNVDDRQSIASHFGVRSIPTIIFFAHGKKQWEEVGARPAGFWRKKISESLRK